MQNFNALSIWQIYPIALILGTANHKIVHSKNTKRQKYKI